MHKDKLILILCRKVEEVIYNNYWPTEEGRQTEEGRCHILDLVDKIKRLCQP
jgi:hypothetical protein